MYPMLFAVAPIFGDGRMIGFTGRSGFEYWVSHRGNALSGGGEVDRAPVDVPVISPAPPVAVITSSATASAGEVVAVAFRGRAGTRSFGAPTAGATAAPRGYRLADGAELVFAVVWYVDRRGTVYRHSIKPDVTSAGFDETAAVKWLMATASCSRTH
jgi:carboxyl-terminal processing protease